MKESFVLRPAFSENNIPIVTSAGEHFMPYTGVLLKSILQNASDKYNYDFIVMHDDVSEKTKNTVMSIVGEKSNVSLRFVDVTEKLKHYNLTSYAEYVPALANARLLIPDLLPDCNKVIWIDSDIVVDHDISELYNIDISDDLIAAVPDLGMSHLYYTKDYYMTSILDNVIRIKPREYFNGGVQLINNKEFRKLYTAEHCLQTAARSDIRLQDQDAMNILCKGRVKYLSVKWNARANYKYPERNFAPQDIQKDFEEARKSPFIVHYIGSRKPGEYPKIEMGEYFWKYAEQTPYNKQYWEERTSKAKAIVAQKENSKEEGDIHTANQSKKKGLLTRLKQRLLPPSSRSFHEHATRTTRKLKKIDSRLIKGTIQSNRLSRRIEGMEQKVDSLYSQTMFEKNKVQYISGEKIRIMFLFQVASFWPNWESFFNACLEDPLIETHLLYLNDINDEVSQMISARKFLDENNFDYKVYSEDMLYEVQPHIVVMQTPYDYGHRKGMHHAVFYKKHGHRVMYIPYGIELSDTIHAQNAHFSTGVVKNAWRIYTFSKRMEQDYFYRSENGSAARGLGHPKFDAFAEKEQFQISDQIKAEANGRKIVLWHMHFPKVVVVNKQKVMCTPYLSEYRLFLDYIKKDTELFYVIMPHPKFCEEQEGRDLIDAAKDVDNIYVDWADDYRPTLFNADCMITDRSALMIEVAPTNVPVLYLHNADFTEPLTKAIQPLVNSYYSGTGYAEMISFMEQFKKGEDPKKDERIDAVKKCLPKIDGRCGERIKDDIIKSLKDEYNVSAEVENEKMQDEITSTMGRSVHNRLLLTEMRMKREVRSGFYNHRFDLEKSNILPSKSMTADTVYNDFFYQVNRYNSVNSALTVFRLLYPILNPTSVVDFGCGTGTWLYVTKLFGANRVLGLDGEYVDKTTLMIEPDEFRPMNLEYPEKIDERFDLAISVEVAEHLHEEFADGYLAKLCSVSDIILFSAAHPGQGGDDHFNEQPFEYWQEKFESRGFEHIEIRPLFKHKNDLEIGYEYRTNMTIYARENVYDGLNEKISKLVEENQLI